MSHKNHHTRSFFHSKKITCPLKTCPKTNKPPKYLNPSITSHPAKSSFDSFIVLKDHAARWERCHVFLNKLWIMGPDKVLDVLFLFAAACGIRQRLPKDIWHTTSLKQKCNGTTVVVWCCLCLSKESREVSVPNFKINCGWGSIISKSNNKHHKAQHRNSMMLLYRSRCPATFGPMFYW